MLEEMYQTHITGRPNNIDKNEVPASSWIMQITIRQWHGMHCPTFLTAGSAAGSSAGIVFYSRADLGFFSPRRGDTLHRSRWNLAGSGPLLHAKFHLDRFRGGGLRPPKLKKWNFTNIIAHKGRVPCTIFFYKIYKFYARTQST